MRHHIFSTAIGFGLAAAFLTAGATSAAAGDPTGYWRKANQGEHPAKMQLYRCGGRNICVKIVWLKNPRDSKGRVLQDVRNVNPAMRGRTIEGMHIIRKMPQVSSNQWKGTVYNPEDGKTYSATVTLASSSKVVLKGCVARFLCREQVWLRTSAPPPKEEEKTPETQVEASAEPAPAITASTAGAAATASPDVRAASSDVSNAELLKPSAASAPQPGYRYIDKSAAHQGEGGYSGESVSSMFSMATPLARESAASAAPAPSAPAQAAAPVQREAAVQPRPAATPSAPASEAAAPQPAPAQPAPVEAAEETPTPPPAAQTAEADVGEGRLSWRERRQLRRQQRLKELQSQGQNLIPWLR
ncbi:MAG: DUF2147 domain-containing protein [Pseudomonadota bacterium]